MATTLEHVQEFLDEYDVRYDVDEDRDAVVIGFLLPPGSTTYRDNQGKARIRLVVRLLEQGEFVTVFAPQAWSLADCPHLAAVSEALVAIQTQHKLLRFDYDPADGELRPNVEHAVEDGELSSRQLHRMIDAVMHGVTRFDGVIRHAMATGAVSFASVEQADAAAAPTAEIARLQRLAEEAGGIAALECIAAGGDKTEPTHDDPPRVRQPGADAATAANATVAAACAARQAGAAATVPQNRLPMIVSLLWYLAAGVVRLAVSLLPRPKGTAGPTAS